MSTFQAADPAPGPAHTSSLGRVLIDSRIGGVWTRGLIAGRWARRIARTRWRTVTKPLAVATAGLAIASTAYAADCVGGYRVLENNLLLKCEEPAGALASDQSDPATTGSIGRAAASEPRTMAAPATRQEDCEPGGYWYLQTEEAPWSAVPMACR